MAKCDLICQTEEAQHAGIYCAMGRCGGMAMDFNSGEQLLKLCKEQNAQIWEIMLAREEQFSNRETALERMGRSYNVMNNSVLTALSGNARPIGGLIGGEARRMVDSAGDAVCSPLLARAAGYAMGVLETNASMGLIAAAPTAGSSGVLPGVLMALEEARGYTRGQLVKALYVAGAVGLLIAQNATVSGAQGGCQAEVGTASAMAAAAAAWLGGASPEGCLTAASIALINLLGLVCDPVAGLVQVPCQTRNAMGVANALVCAQMALSSITSLIPFDQAVDAMSDVGGRLPPELKESALAGAAATPAACAACKSLKMF